MSERRESVRADVVVAVRYRTPDSSEARLSTTMNLSGGGLCLLVPDPMPRGTQVEVELTLPGEARIIAFAGEVIWDEPNPDAGTIYHRAGLRILRIDPKDHDALVRYCLKTAGGAPPPAPSDPSS